MSFDLSSCKLMTRVKRLSLMRGKGRLLYCYMVQSSPSRMNGLSWRLAAYASAGVPGCEIEIERIGSMTSTASAPHAAQPVASSAIRQCVDTTAPGQSSSTIWTIIMGFWYQRYPYQREATSQVRGRTPRRTRTSRQSGNSPESASPSRPMKRAKPG